GIDGTWKASADVSAEGTGCGGVVSICAELDVPGIFRWMGWAVGDLRAGGHGGNRGGACDCAVRGFVCVVYEEPKLRRLFGEEYVEYCRNVRRWVPRTHAWGKMRRGSDALEGF